MFYSINSNSSFVKTLCLAGPLISPSNLSALSIRPCFNPQFQHALIVLMKMALVLGLDGSDVDWAAASSDERLKDISSDAFPYGLDTINSLTPIKYKWKKNPGLGDRFGFGAQTAQSIIPELISESSFLLDNGEKKLVMEYRMMHSILVKAIQELSAKVTALENA